MEFDGQCFTHPTISLRFYKDDLLREISDYEEKCPEVVKFMEKVRKEKGENIEEFANILIVGLFPRLKGYEEIRFNYILLLCEKYRDIVQHAFRKVAPNHDLLIYIFLAMYDSEVYTTPELVAKFKMYYAKCIMLGIFFDNGILNVMRLIRDMRTSAKEVIATSKFTKVKLQITLYVILLYFQNGYNPYVLYAPGKDIPLDQTCIELITDGSTKCVERQCKNCKEIGVVFKTYEFYLKNASLADLIKAKDDTWKPNAVTINYTIGPIYS